SPASGRVPSGALPASASLGPASLGTHACALTGASPHGSFVTGGGLRGRGSSPPSQPAVIPSARTSAASRPSWAGRGAGRTRGKGHLCIAWSLYHGGFAPAL